MGTAGVSKKTKMVVYDKWTSVSCTITLIGILRNSMSNLEGVYYVTWASWGYVTYITYM